MLGGEKVDSGGVGAVEKRTFEVPLEEHDLADYFANVMSDIGLHVEMMDVTHPTDPSKTSRQPIGRLVGTGGGPSLMFNGHMDTIGIMSGWTVDPYGRTFKDGWIWGVGAHDDKGGLVAAICGMEAIIRTGTRLKGDILVCPVVAHKIGGVGTRAALKKGIKADCCINIEHSTNTIATTIVGVVQIKITTRNKGLFFRYSPEAKAAYHNAVEQQAEIILRLGPSLDPHGPDSWITFNPHADLPGFPMHRVNSIHKEPYPRECEMMMEIRTVPGQTDDQVRADITKVIEDLKARHPNLDYEITIPGEGPDDLFHMDSAEIAKDHPLVVSLAEGQRLASNRDPVVGGGLRIGNVGDGNLITMAGIPSLQYGPGDIRNYPEWPAPDERVELRELVEASRAMAYAALKYCG